MSSPDAGPRFVELLTMMARLRGEGGCPWDREQTRETLRPFLVEETYEVLDALDAGDPTHVREELGDLLFQVVFHAEIARERGEFSMADLLEALDRQDDSPASACLRGSARQLGRGGAGAVGSHQGRRDSGRSVGACGRAARAARAPPCPARPAQGGARRFRLGRRGGRAGEGARGARRGRGGLASRRGTALRDELGDLLFSVVNVARLSSVDPEGALQAAVDRFSRRFASMEEAARDEGRELTGLSLAELEAALDPGQIPGKTGLKAGARGDCNEGSGGPGRHLPRAR